MIIAKYLTRQILFATFAIMVVLLLVIFSGRLASYIGDAAAGKLAASIVFPMMLFRIPEFLQLILPVSLFLGVLLSFGELYEHNEMTVLNAGGVSDGKILCISMVSGAFIALVVAICTFYVAPKGGAYVEKMLRSEGLKNELSAVVPGVFYELEDQGSTIYTRELSEDRSVMSDVFVFQTSRPSSVSNSSVTNKTTHGQAPDTRHLLEQQAPIQTLIFAEKGYQEYGENGGFYVVLENGRRYEGIPGESQFRVTQFEKYSQRINAPDAANRKKESHELATISELFLTKTPKDTAELHWRLSMPVLVLVLCFLAVPLSKTGPRQGRFVHLLPGFLLYFVYLVALNTAKNAIADQSSWGIWAMWLVHVGFVVVGIVLLLLPAIKAHMHRIRYVQPSNRGAEL